MKEYATIYGAWGDILVSIQECFKQGYSKFLILSNQSDIENFMLAQNFVEDVIKLPFEEKYLSMLNNERDLSDYCSKLFHKNISVKNLSFDYSNNTTRYDIYKSFNVDEKSKKWAMEIYEQLPEKFILFQPYSINSSSMSDHWKYWDQLIKYHLSKKINVVACGRNIDFSKFDKFDNFYDISNSTNSFQQIFALCHYADKIISTSNGLSFYCASNDIESIIIMNRSASNYFSGFNRAIFSKKIKKIDFNCPLLEAISIIENNKKYDNLYQILACFPYLTKEEIYNILKNKNSNIYLQIKQGKITSVYSELGFDPLVLSFLVLCHDKFIYHIKYTNENEKYKWEQNILFFEEIFNKEIDFKFVNEPILKYDLITK